MLTCLIYIARMELRTGGGQTEASILFVEIMDSQESALCLDKAMPYVAGKKNNLSWNKHTTSCRKAKRIAKVLFTPQTFNSAN